MKTKFSKKYILDNCGCYKDDLNQVKQLFKKYPENITLERIIKSDIPLEDKLWFLFDKCNLKLNQKLELSFELAKIVSVTYNKEYPDDNRINDCLKAIQDYNEGNISLSDLRAAAYAAANVAANAAYAAAYAANAADAAANAADAAAYAANAAANAAYAAAYAANAADAAAYAANAAAYAANAADAANVKKEIIEYLLNYIK